MLVANLLFAFVGRAQDTATAAYESAKRAFLTGDIKLASTEIERALQLAPNSADAHRLKGSILTKLEKLQDALAEYDIAIKLNPRDAASHYNIGWVLDQQGKMVDAEAAYGRALAMGPDAMAFNNRGWLRYRLGRSDDARADLEQAIAVDDDYLQAHLNLGSVNVKTGRYTAAVPHLTRVIEADAQNIAALEQRAVAYDKLNKRREARRDREAAAALRLQGIKPGIRITL